MEIRNLEMIEEREPSRAGRRLGAWLLAAMGAGAIALTVVFSPTGDASRAESTADPLGDLIAAAKHEQRLPPDQLSRDNASFAKILSDREPPSTAVVAVKGADGKLIDPADQPPAAPDPPTATDQLPVVPLPVGRLLDSTQLSNRPADPLLEMAADRSRPPPGAPQADPGSAGQYQIQVASFREEADAEALVRQLRLRGHEAYRQSARVPDRGLWHRVRVGPFKYKYEALRYQAEFERKEQMATLLVDPGKVERQKVQRAAKLAARRRRKQRAVAQQ